MEETGSPFGLASADLFEKIDRLFACNVGEYVDLPQLVVVGDQSSGKSSVLEALTKLPFPRESGVCTRFAAQIKFRRSQETHVTVSVIPAQDASEEHKTAPRAWTMNGLRSLDAGSFANIMTQVNAVMDLMPDETRSKSIFSGDVLCLEIATTSSGAWKDIYRSKPLLPKDPFSQIPSMNGAESLFTAALARGTLRLFRSTQN